MDDKLGLRPRKPPRRNLSISPVRIYNHLKDCFPEKYSVLEFQPISLSKVRSNNWESETGDSSSTCSRKTKVLTGFQIILNHLNILDQSSQFQGHRTVYSSKSGSKSFDELDDLLCEKPRKSNSKRRGRRTQSSVSGADVLKASERRQAAERRRGGAAPECRHSCDEVSHSSLSSSVTFLRFWIFTNLNI